jgi:hypothetical protein
MRIYEGSPRQDWEEVLRSVGAYLDDRGLRGLVFLETDTGFIIQGTVVQDASGSSWGEALGKATRVTLTLEDDQVAAFMDEALAKRGQGGHSHPSRFESELRVIGKYLDDQKPKDIFFFELDGSYVIRLSIAGQGGLKQTLVEFTAADIAELISKAPALRRDTTTSGRKPG